MLKTEKSVDALLPPTEALTTEQHNLKQALFNAVLNDQIESVKSLLARGANPNVINMHGQTPLSIAVRDGHVDMVNELVNHGANPEHCTRFGNTPLYIAAVGCHYEIAKLFLLHQYQRYQPENPYYKVLRRLNAHALTLIQQSMSFMTIADTESYRHEKIEFLVLLIESLLKQYTFKCDVLLQSVTSLERRYENALYHGPNKTRSLFMAVLKCIYTGDTREI